ncbi:hypothetical protein F7725_024095, partial [Dissostichus mawsoni]
MSPQAAVMDLLDRDKERRFEVHVWYTYSDLLNQAGSYSPIEKVERLSFYERAKEAETALYGNLILKKG